MMEKVKFTGYDSVFAERLRGLMSENGTTQKELAGVTGITRQAISQYMDGSIQPNIEKLYKIADYFKVSADYLIGLSDVRSFDLEVKVICEKTGLSETVVETINFHKKNKNDYLCETINFLIENEFPPKLWKGNREIDDMEDVLKQEESEEEQKMLKKVIDDKKAFLREEERQWHGNHFPLLPSIRDYLNIVTTDEDMLITKDGIFKADEFEDKEIETTFAYVGLNDMVEQTLLNKITEILKYLKKFKSGFRYEL